MWGQQRREHFFFQMSLSLPASFTIALEVMVYDLIMSKYHIFAKIASPLNMISVYVWKVRNVLT